ncbi:MAG TPA: CHAD domain-containing protein [Candidatus Sulfotelmatobacter sp.]|nr:CHAD domain-containing protein [Candidatus Sulfotelmatobacter sp.]
MSIETELKLQLDPSGLEKLKRHPLVQTLKQGRPQTKLQKSVYFDTADFRLRAEGVVLRVRHIGRRRIQTVKTMGTCIGGAWARDEWECEITGDVPDFAPLAETPLADLFAEDGLAASLRPAFATEINRTTYCLGDGVWEVELALDRGQLVTAQGSAPVCEAELELKAGPPRHLFELALALQADLPARLMTATKASRGYRLADGSQPQPQKGVSPDLSADATAAEAFRAIAHACAGQLLMNQDCLIETRDPEAIHQMRIAQRRLRSAMNVFKTMLETPQTARIKDELRWLQTLLGPARDTDVFIDEILAPLEKDLAGDAGFVGLLSDFQQKRLSLYDRATAEVCGPRFTRLMLELGRWCESGDWQEPLEAGRKALLAEPAIDLARRTLEKREHNVFKSLQHLSKLDSHHRHLSRIEVKKLRYAIEFFGILFEEKQSRKFSHSLAVLQDGLGLLNDIAVSRAALKQWAEESGDPERLWAAGLIAGWHAARVPALLQDASKAAKSFRSLPRFWQASDLKPKRKGSP